MSRYFLLIGIVLIFSGCGPEAESSAAFSRAVEVVSQARLAGAAADSIVPALDSTLLKGIDLNYLTGKFDPAAHAGFAVVKSPYTHRPGMWLRRETLTAFQDMWAAAKKEGILLDIISATRTFDQQKTIWQGKWARFATETPEPLARVRRILEYSAMPGASRHHWGTDVDLNDLNNSAFEPGGRYEKVYAWLQKHAHEYGFCQPYSPKGAERPEGYNEERWHWSYMPLSGPFLQQYQQLMRDELFSGFSGAESAPALQMVKHYASGINRSCR